MARISEKEIVAQARSWLGTKYHHQGRLKKSPTTKGGVDCIGLVVGVVEELGIHNGQGKPLSAYDETGYSMYPDGRRLLAAIQAHMRMVAVDDVRPGDVALFKMFSDPQHVGLITDYPGGGIGLIHCNSSAGAVVEQPLSDTWKRMLVGVYRFKRNQLHKL